MRLTHRAPARLLQTQAARQLALRSVRSRCRNPESSAAAHRTDKTGQESDIARSALAESRRPNGFCLRRPARPTTIRVHRLRENRPGRSALRAWRSTWLLKCLRRNSRGCNADISPECEPIETACEVDLTSGNHNGALLRQRQSPALCQSSGDTLRFFLTLGAVNRSPSHCCSFADS